MRRVLVLLTALAVVWTPTAGAMVRWFYSPSRNIGCEVAAAAPQGTHAFCQTNSPARTVTLKANGRMKVCRGAQCIGNGPENAFTLGYGRSVRVGPFRCTSRKAGMTCLVTRSGHGFFISRERLRLF